MEQGVSSVEGEANRGSMRERERETERQSPRLSEGFRAFTQSPAQRLYPSGYCMIAWRALDWDHLLPRPLQLQQARGCGIHGYGYG